MKGILRLPWIGLGLLVVACGGGADPTATRVPAAPTATTAPAVAAPIATTAPAVPGVVVATATAAPVVAAAPKQTPVGIVLPTPTTVAAGVVVEKEVPKYGGILRWGTQLSRNATGNYLASTLVKPGLSTSSNIATNISNNLFLFDSYTTPKNEFVGDAAESWSYNDDKTVLTIKMRQGVKWHDGTPMVAEDFAFTLRSIANPPVGYSSRHSGWSTVAIQDLNVVDASTLIITQKKPSVEFLQLMGTNTLQLIPSHLSLEEQNDLGIGTGPFRLKKGAFRRDISNEIERNPDYWDKWEGHQLPFIDGIKFFDFRDEKLASAALRTGRVQFTDVANSPMVDHQADILVKEVPGIFIDQRLAANFGVIIKNKVPFDDRKVLEAIDLWIDRREIVDLASSGAYRNKTVAEGGGSIWLSGLIALEHGGRFGLPPEEMMQRPGYRQVERDTGKPIITLEQSNANRNGNLAKDPRDLERAKDLLEEAGIKQGTVALEILVGTSEITRSGPVFAAEMAKLFGKAWPIKNSFRGDASVAKGRFNIFVTAMGISPMVGSALKPWTRATTRGPKQGGWPADDPFSVKIERLMIEQDTIFDVAKRKEVLFELQRLILDWRVFPLTYARQGGGAAWPEIRNAPDAVTASWSVRPYRLDRVWLSTATRSAP